MSPSDDELLDVLDEEGRPVATRTRRLVHRDGDWHGLVFAWSAWSHPRGRSMLLQQRSRPGDPYAAQVDALAGGHIAAGESAVDAARRELVEEVGLAAGADDFVHLGSNRLERAAGPCRRVVQHLLLYPLRLDLAHLRFGAEVDGFVEVDLDLFAELVSGHRPALPARQRFARDGGAVGDGVLGPGSVALYPEEILDTFRRSLASIRTYLEEGVVDPVHFA